MSTTENQDHILSDRGGIVENRHLVHAAITSPTGHLLYTTGSPTRLTLSRSAIKPAQALAILSTGCFTHFGFNNADLALMCASHSSEERHVTRARGMLEKVRVREEVLRCGGHAALSGDVNNSWIRSGYTPTAVCNNCSGKHVGMVAGARVLGGEVGDYHRPEHPMQLRVKDIVEELCDLGASTDELVKWGIDGCNLPAPAFPLHCLAKIYAIFAEGADAIATQQQDTLSPRTQALGRIFNAMTQYPELVGGDGRFCTRLMEVFQGTIIGKLGADGCYGIGIRASEETRRLGTDGAIGVAVKIEDGNIGMLYSAVVEIFEQLGIGTPGMLRELGDFHHPVILNTAGVVTGHVSHAFKVRPA